MSVRRYLRELRADLASVRHDLVVAGLILAAAVVLIAVALWMEAP